MYTLTDVGIAAETQANWASVIATTQLTRLA